MIINLTPQQFVEVNAFVRVETKCDLCRCTLHEGQKRALLAQPSSDKAENVARVGKMSVISICWDCFGILNSAITSCRGAK